MTWPNPRAWSLMVKMPLTITAAVVGVAVIIGATIVAQDRMRLYKELEDKTLLLAQAVAATAPEAVLRGDHWTLFQNLRQVASRTAGGASRTSVVTGMVLDAEGRVLAHLDPAEYPLGLRLPPEQRIADQALASLRDGGEPRVVAGGGEAGYLEGVVPVFADGKLLAVVRVRLSTAELSARTWRAAATVFGLTLGLAAVGSLLGTLASRRMVRPLEALALGMETLGRGELSKLEPVPVVDRDEIGRLTERFNRMATELGEKKRLEEELAVSEKLAGLGRIAVGVAHEVNNPLGGMLNCVNTLKKHPDDPDLLRRYLALLESGLNRIAATVQGLLVEVRGEASPVPCDLACLADLRELVAAEVGDRNIALEWDNAVGNGLRLNCSCPHVQQMVLNLTKNSIQAMPQGGALAFRSRHEDGSLILEVEDDGIGIPEEDRRHLFDPFFTGHPSGSGLGLWVTYRLVQRMHGTIQVDSRPGQGSRFRIRLPLEGAAGTGMPR